MAQPYKGERRAFIIGTDLAVRRRIHALATDSRLGVSQYVANQLALHVGRPDLVEAPSARFRAKKFDPDVKTVTIRCHNDVGRAVAEQAAHAGYPAAATYVIDFVVSLAKNGSAAEVEPAGVEYAYQEELLTSA
ncbi:hypothetical protein EB74_16465 [Mycobacterium sp. SWH-M5]|nr:hypothetical protein EB74_16465 [Mycobacterium sp. SWH-M5]